MAVERDSIARAKTLHGALRDQVAQQPLIDASPFLVLTAES
jgi:hypothetical protein